MTDVRQPRRNSILAILVLALLHGCTDDPDPAVASSSAAPTGIRFLADTGEDSGDFSQALAPQPFEFPRDHLPHPQFRTEWWYFTGNLFSGNGRHFGFELTFFRIALAAGTAEADSAFASNQLWMGHFALTDTEGRQFTASERLSRGIPGVAGSSMPADNSAVALRIEDWSIDYDGNTAALRAGNASTGINLSLDGLDRIVLQGDAGLDAKGPEPGNASYYFSAPRLTVTGEVMAKGREVEVSGSAWMDREWSTSALSPDMAGWDWFALQLDDGRDLMFYRLRGADGSTSEFSGGTIVNPDGLATRLDADAVELEVTRQWSSPSSGSRYPVAWRLRIPGQDLLLDVDPRIDDQELDLTVRYWEGAVTVSGSDGGRPVQGVGYLELAGY